MKPTKRKKVREFWIVDSVHKSICCHSSLQAEVVAAACIGKTEIINVREVLKPRGKK